MALKSQGRLFAVVPWHPTEILEQTEPLPVVAVVCILILEAVTQIPVVGSALLRLILMYEASLEIRRGGGQGCISISLCLPSSVPLTLCSLHLCALPSLHLPDRKEIHP